MNEYYKKIDKSFFNIGITIKNDYANLFLQDENIKVGTSKKINIIFNNIEYICNFGFYKNSNGSYYQLRWDSNYELLTELKKEFIQSYFAIINQNYIAKKNQKYYITKLTGGTQEVALFKFVEKNKFLLEPYIKIETQYDNIFKEMVDQNIFGWLSKEKNIPMIIKETEWIDLKELSLHSDINYVIYYLLDEINNEIYIGSAKRLGDRVKPNRKEIPGWNKFRYEIIHPSFHSQLRQIEYHSINNFARFFNCKKCNKVDISKYKLVNKDFGYYNLKKDII